MNLQYISDNKGQPTGVFIPIRDWNRLKKKYKELEIAEQSTFDIPEWHKTILDKRLEEIKNNPESCIDFDAACNEIEKNL